MPEGEPGSERLSDVHHQYRDCSAVTDNAKNDGTVDHRFEFVLFQNVKEESCEEGSRTECDNGEIEIDPQAERKAIVHVCLVQAFHKAQGSGVHAPKEQQHPGKNPNCKMFE
jgi:hypothetical protein